MIAEAAQLVLDPKQPLHHEFIAAGPSVGFSEAMTAEALRNTFTPLSGQALAGLSPTVPSHVRILMPEFIFHVLAGNLFVSGIESINTALLLGASSLVRCSEADQIFPELWQRAIANVAPEFGQAICVMHWPSRDTQLTRAACEESDVVIAFGSDESVAAIRALTPVHVQFSPHGNKVSFAIVAADALHADISGVARGLAYDFSVYEQQGCLSPRAVFVERGTEEELLEFQDALLQEMRALEQQLPPANLELAASAALAREREEARIESALSSDTQLWSMQADRFVITCRPAASFRLGCVNRFVDIRLFSNMDELVAVLAPYRGIVATLGVGGTPQLVARLQAIVRANRICRVGQMQKPPIGWTHDGRLPLSDLVQWVSIDEF